MKGLGCTVKRLLIYRIGSLGDTVVALPCFHLIERVFPNAERVLITNRSRNGRSATASAVLGNSGLIHRTWQIKVGARDALGLLRLLFLIRWYNPNALVYLSEYARVEHLHRDKAFFRLAGVKRFYGMSSKSDLQRVSNSTEHTTEAEAFRLARTIAALGDANPADPINWDLRLTQTEKHTAIGKLGGNDGRPFIVCGPATNKQASDWGKERWRALIGELTTLYPQYGLVLVGAHEDFAVSDFIGEAWKGRIFNLCGKLSPRESAAVIERARAYIGPDSGPMHLAAAVGTPCVVAFAARTIPTVWFPAGNRHRVIYRQTDCRGCELDVCITEGKKCLTSISVEDMVQAVRQVLDENSLSSASAIAASP